MARLDEVPQHLREFLPKPLPPETIVDGAGAIVSTESYDSMPIMYLYKDGTCGYADLAADKIVLPYDKTTMPDNRPTPTGDARKLVYLHAKATPLRTPAEVRALWVAQQESMKDELRKKINLALDSMEPSGTFNYSYDGGETRFMNSICVELRAAGWEANYDTTTLVLSIGWPTQAVQARA